MATGLSNKGLEIDSLATGEEPDGGGGKVMLYASGSGSDARLYVKAGSDTQTLLGIDIDQLGAAAKSDVDQSDHLLISDGGTEKKITFSNLEDAIFANLGTDVSVADGGAVTIVNNAVTNAKLADMTQGTVKVGGSSNAPTDLDAKGDGKILVGDGTDVNSVAISGDITLLNDGTVGIASGVIVNADIKSDAAIAFSKMANLATGRALVSDGSGDVSVSAVTSDEIALLDDAAAGTVVNSKAVIYGSGGQVNGTILSASAGLSGSNLTLNGASVTSTAAELNLLDGAVSANNVAGKAVILDGSGHLTLAGDLTVQGTTTTVDVEVIQSANGVIFEGATADANETTLKAVDPTSDQTIQLANQSGFLIPFATVSTTQITSSPEELNLLDGSSAGTVANSKAVIYGGSGEVNATTLQIGGVSITSTAAELNLVDGSVAGTVVNSKAVIYGDGGQVNGAILSASAGLSGSNLTLNGVSVTSTAAELNYLDDAAAANSVAGKAALVGTSGDFKVHRNLTVDGNVTLGNNSSDTISPNGVFGASIIPGTDNLYNLGNSGARFVEVHANELHANQLARALDCDNQDMTNVDINSGAIDGTIIGATSAAAVSASHLVSNGGLDLTGMGSANKIARFFRNGETTLPMVAIASGSSGFKDALALRHGQTNLMFTSNFSTASEAAIFTSGASAATALVLSSSHDITFQSAPNGLISFGHDTNGSTVSDVRFFGEGDTDFAEWDASANQWVYKDGNTQYLSIGAQAATGFAIDVGDGAGNANSNNRGKIRAAAFVTYSDRNLKKDITPMNDALDKVMALDAVSYKMKNSDNKEIGFIAQDVAKVVPEVCALDANGEGRGIDYSRMTALLAGAVKTQQAQIENLQKVIANLQK